MTLQEIMQRRAELKAEIAKRSADMTLEDIKKVNEELDKLDKTEKEIRAKQELDKRMANLETETKVEERGNTPFIPLSNEALQKQDLEKRGALYKAKAGSPIELRSNVKKSSDAGVLIPSHLSNEVAAYPWNEVSSIVDLVNVIPLTNGSEYTKAFQITTGEGAYTLEPTKTNGSDDGVYHEVDTTFDQVTIKRNKVTALTYMSEELESLPDADYADLVERNVSLSIKKKLAKEIILGDGTSNHFVGIAVKTSDSLNSNTHTDKDYSIDENTLINMMIDYGGDEDVEAKQVLVMNKQTIKDFAKVRGTDKRPVYNITISGNTFTIDGYRGVFSAHIKPYSTASTGDIWAVYGDMSKYDLLNFGGEAIETSRDFKFSQGITAVRGRVYAGGNITGYKAMLRATKPASAAAAAEAKAKI